MAKRDNLSVKYPLNVEQKQASWEDEIENEEKPTIVIPEPTKYNKGISNTILIRSRLDANYKTTGAVSGREYIFNGGGSVAEVNKEDVDELLSRIKRKGCCGGASPNSIFELA